MKEYIHYYNHERIKVKWLCCINM
ncbi:IS3 family transposase [Acinetobacter indicus]